MLGDLAIQVRAHFADFADFGFIQLGLVFDNLELLGPLFGEFVQGLEFGFVCQLSDDGEFVAGQGVGFAAFFLGSGYGDDFGFDCDALGIGFGFGGFGLHPRRGKSLQGGF